MNYSLMIDMVMARLARYKLKTLLMSMGIVISVAATLVLQTAGRGILDSIDSFNSHAYPIDTVVVYSSSSGKLQVADAEAIAGSIGEVRSWDPGVDAGTREIKIGNRNARVPVTGYSERAEAIGRRGVVEGQFLSAEHVSSRAHVALIGTTSARALFGEESPVGATIFVDNIAFEVVGVLEPIGVDPHSEDLDDTVVVPYTVLMEQMLRTEYISGVRIMVSDPSRVESVGARVREVLRERHGIISEQKDDFNVVTPVMIQKMVSRALRIYDIFLPLISGTVFLISGLVILAVMMITVRERTAEIGLRKALGARPRDVMIQVLVEGLIVAAVAALLGLLLAKLVAGALAPLMAVKFGVKSLAPTVQTMLLSVAVAVATALIGALLPARRAAKLDPATAIR